MLEPTKKRHTDERVELHFIGPKQYKDLAIKIMENLDFIKKTYPSTQEKYIDVDELLPVLSAGEKLSGYRLREGMTQTELSQKTGIPKRRISEMENGKRIIENSEAKKFAKALRADYRMFV